MTPLSGEALSRTLSIIDTYRAAHEIAGWPQGEPEWWARRATHDGTLRYIPLVRTPIYLDYIVDNVIAIIVGLYQDRSWADDLPEIWEAVEAMVLEMLANPTEA